jgi:hypothetical protein
MELVWQLGDTDMVFPSEVACDVVVETMVVVVRSKDYVDQNDMMRR